MKDSNHPMTGNVAHDAANPGNDEKALLKLVEPGERRQAERRAVGERRNSNSGEAKNTERRSLLDRRSAERRASDKEMGDKK